MMANDIESDDQNATDWTAIETDAPVIVAVKCKTGEKICLYLEWWPL